MHCFCGMEMKKRLVNHMLFYHCPNCGHMNKITVLDAASEKKRYDAHVCDEGYFRYMEGVYEKVKPYLREGISLDFGCGKTHSLRDIFLQDNRQCLYYDLYYFPEYPKGPFDNIILIEVFEHIRDSYTLLQDFKRQLKPHGKILIMTKPLPASPEGWWYLRDITHISFFTEKSMQILADLLGFHLVYDAESSLFIFESI